MEDVWSCEMRDVDEIVVVVLIDYNSELAARHTEALVTQLGPERVYFALKLLLAALVACLVWRFI